MGYEQVHSDSQGQGVASGEEEHVVLITMLVMNAARISLRNHLRMYS